MDLRPPSGLRTALAVARKELVESLRDKQTTIYAIVLPIALYPALFWCLIQGMLFVQGRKEHTPVRVAIATAEPEALAAGLQDALGAHVDGPGGEPLNAVEIVAIERARDVREARQRFEAWLDLAAAGPQETAPDALLWIDPSDAQEAAPDAGQDADAPGSRLFFAGTRTRSQIARERIEERLPELADGLRADALGARGKRPADLLAYVRDPLVNLARESDMVAYVLSFVLPMLMVMMCVMGAFFPAVDLTAGERERKTSETTLLLPVPRGAVHQGKILAVCAMAVLATSLNLVALGLSAGHLLGMLPGQGALASELPLTAFLAVAPLAVLFAFFVSAVLTGVASFARTFKEGQALIGPVQMVFILPAMAGAIPGLELDAKLACVPVVNVVLSFKALLQGRMLPLEYALTALSLLAVALFSMAIAVRLLSREAVVASEKKTSLASLLRPRRPKEADAR